MLTTEPEARAALARLERRLNERRAWIDQCEAYYDGEHPLLFATSKYRDAFGALLEPMADNWCELVVDAKVERLGIEGFRFGDTDGADDAATAIWQANGLDVQSTVGHRTAATTGYSYLLVAPANAEESGHDEPIVTIEHPSQFIVECSPVNRRLRRAALKIWEDEGVRYANVYGPDWIFRYRSGTKRLETPAGRTELILPSTVTSAGGWEWMATLPNPAGVVTGIPMVNKPDAFGRGRSDLKAVMPIQNALNKLWADLMIASEYVSFPQRWATGIAAPTDEDGNELEDAQFVNAVARMWVSEDEKAKFGQLDAADLKSYVSAIELGVQHVAARTRTPPHYLLGQSGAFPSGESLKATETGLVAKCLGAQEDGAEAWEEAMRVAFLLKGDTAKATDLGAETMWRDAESRTDAERADALLKYDVPKRFMWEKSGMFTQREIERMVELDEAEQDRALSLGTNFDFTPASQGEPTPPQPVSGPVA